MTLVDHYETLRVAPDATQAEIDAAYRREARHWHPDRNTAREAATRMAAVNAAHDVLAHPVQRAAYDTRRSAARPPRPRLSAPRVRWHLHQDERPVPVRIALWND